MKRRLFNLATLLSALVLIGVVALLPLSYHAAIDVYWKHGQNLDEAVLSRGQLTLQRLSGTVLPPEFNVSLEDPFDPSILTWPGSLTSLPGHYVHRGTPAPGKWNVRVWQFPIIDVALIALVLPGIWAYRRAGRRRGPGHCSTCGYDLRASNERCPECGNAITAVIA